MVSNKLISGDKPVNSLNSYETLTDTTTLFTGTRICKNIQTQPPYVNTYKELYTNDLVCSFVCLKQWVHV